MMLLLMRRFPDVIPRNGVGHITSAVWSRSPYVVFVGIVSLM